MHSVTTARICCMQLRRAEGCYPEAGFRGREPLIWDTPQRIFLEFQPQLRTPYPQILKTFSPTPPKTRLTEALTPKILKIFEAEHKTFTLAHGFGFDPAVPLQLFTESRCPKASALPEARPSE
jgi:hypothetical protein